MTLVRKKTAPYFPVVLDELLNTDWLGGRAQNFTNAIPAVNIMETNNAYKVEVAAPGLEKENFNIELNNDLLTISAEQKSAETDEVETKFTRREFSFANFTRSFTLPDTVNTADISATYKNGILVIGLPKREEAQVQPARLIDIT